MGGLCGWLSEQILEVSQFGRSLPTKSLHSDENRWWIKLRAEIKRERGPDCYA
jgi:hypothetical protein